MLEALFKDIVWLAVTEGPYNGTVVSSTEVSVGGFTGKWVKRGPDSRDGVEKWNKIHQEPYQAYRLSDGSWITPHLGDVPASDALVAEAVLAIYRRTGEIIITAAYKHCFVLHEAKAKWVQIEMTEEEEALFDADEITYAETQKIIAHLVYLDRYFSFADIRDHDRYFSADTVRKLRLFRIENVQLTAELIAKLPDIPIEYIPVFAKKLSILEQQGHILNVHELNDLWFLHTGNATAHIPDEHLYEVVRAPFNSRLHLAAELGLIDLIKKIARYYSDGISFRLMPGGLSLLMVVARSERIKDEGTRADILEGLILLGVPLNLQAKWGVAEHAEEGYTALDYVAARKSREGIYVLVEYGAFTREDIRNGEKSKATISSMTWTPLGKGSYNEVFYSNAVVINGSPGRLVKKIPRATRGRENFLHSNARRAIGVWKHIYEERYLAILSIDAHNNGIWVVQYFGDVIAPDHLAAQAMLDLYNQKGIMVLDGCCESNTRLFGGEVVFIDLDLVTGYGVPKELRVSVSSLCAQLEGEKGYYTTREDKRPLSVRVSRNLLYLEKYIPPEQLKTLVLTMGIILELNRLRCGGIVLTQCLLALCKLQPAPLKMVPMLVEGIGLFKQNATEAVLAVVPGASMRV